MFYLRNKNINYNKAKNNLRDTSNHLIEDFLYPLQFSIKQEIPPTGFLPWLIWCYYLSSITLDVQQLLSSSTIFIIRSVKHDLGII